MNKPSYKNFDELYKIYKQTDSHQDLIPCAIIASTFVWDVYKYISNLKEDGNLLYLSKMYKAIANALALEQKMFQQKEAVAFAKEALEYFDKYNESKIYFDSF